ncbi:LysM peptidoglycan-binding domain-containing protein [Streptomyces sp. S6]
MLSGNGRHRRPRQAPALLVAAGVTGSAIAIPLLGASGASAADGPAVGPTVWDKVAGCETDNAWDENTGSGQFGGLHIKLEDWKKYGGLTYAERPDLASRSDQIAIGQKILADQGPGVWPVCALTSGLTKESGSGPVADDTGSTGTSGSTGKPGSSGVTDPANGAGSTGGSGTGSSTTPSPKPSPSAPSAPSAVTPPAAGAAPVKPSPSAPAAPGAVKPGGEAGGRITPSAPQESDSTPTAPSKVDEPDKPVQSAGSWSLVDTGAGAVGGVAAAAATIPVATEGASTLSAGVGTGRHRGLSADEPTSYTVRSGDTLTSIADSLELDGGWRGLYAANEKLIGSDPSAIVPGQTLSLGE